jgi:hypothetical protein
MWDWDHPPFFKSFLRLDATAEQVRIRCVAATGCGEHETEPPVEDELSWSARTGRWTVHSRPTRGLREAAGEVRP